MLTGGYVGAYNSVIATNETTETTNDLNQLFADVIQGLENTIDGCNFAIDRMVNRLVLFDPTNGSVVLVEGGCWPIPREVGRVAMFKSRAGAEHELADIKKRFADNHVVQRLASARPMLSKHLPTCASGCPKAEPHTTQA